MSSAKDPPSASPDQDAPSPKGEALTDADQDAPSPKGEALTDAERAKLQERRLVRRLRRGDQRAFATIVRTYQQRVFNIVFRFLGNREEAEDVAQDVFVTVYQNAQNFRGDSKFSTWLYRVTVNHCKNRLKYLKRRGRHMGRPLDEVAEHLMAQGSGETQPAFHAAIPRPDELAQGRQLEALILREMGKMDEDHRLLVVLRDIQGMSYQEMADVTGLNVGTIKSRLHRARLALKEALARHMR